MFDLGTINSLLFFFIRCALPIIPMLCFGYILHKLGKEKVLVSISVARITTTSLICISIFAISTSKSIVVVVVLGNVVNSLIYFNDCSILLPELWALNRNVALNSALFVAAGHSGFMLGFLLPMCFNFIELVIAINLLLLATTFCLNFRVKLI